MAPQELGVVGRAGAAVLREEPLDRRELRLGGLERVERGEERLRARSAGEVPADVLARAANAALLAVEGVVIEQVIAVAPCSRSDRRWCSV